MTYFTVIGAGNLGSRHLQALARWNRGPVDIGVYEPSDTAWGVAEQRCKEVASEHAVIRRLSGISEAAKSSLCIVATNADVRPGVMRELLEAGFSGTLVLEKVLFQRPSDYEVGMSLAESSSARIYVNCPRRMVPAFKDIAEKFKSDSRVVMTVFGGDWGLGCNAIHFVDLLAYITGQTDFSYDTGSLDPVVYDSKRAGYVEFCGVLTGRSSRGDVMVLGSMVSSTLPLVVEIASAQRRCRIEASRRRIEWQDAEGVYEEEFSMPFQSELTHILAENVEDGVSPELTTFRESAILHKELILVYLEFLRKTQGIEVERCPIT